MKTYRINNCRLVLPDRCVAGDLRIADGKIESIITESSVGARSSERHPEEFSARGCYVAPGIIDMHTQGFAGIDMATAADGEIEQMSKSMLAYGATSYLATLAYTPGILERIVPWVNEITGGATMLGMYLEGPFISDQRLGAIPPICRLEPSVAALEPILAEAQGHLKIMTVAPEVEGALDVVAELDAAGVVPAIGHSNATYDEAMSGIEAGIRHTTHLFNAMSGLNHREPGVAGAVLSSPHVTAEIIADGLHIHPAAVRIAMHAKGIDNTAIITDAISAAGMPADKDYVIWGRQVKSSGGGVRLEDGRLAGSIVTPIETLRNTVNMAGYSVVDAVRMTSLIPARILGIADKKGSLEIGKDADLIVFDEDFDVQATFVGGELAWERM